MTKEDLPKGCLDVLKDLQRSHKNFWRGKKKSQGLDKKKGLKIDAKNLQSVPDDRNRRPQLKKTKKPAAIERTLKMKKTPPPEIRIKTAASNTRTGGEIKITRGR